MTRRGLCLVIAAPSGAGKSSIGRALVAADPCLSVSVSATTRAPRPGEIDGRDYLFRTQSAFDQMVANGKLLEWATVFGRSYGTPREPVERALAAGTDVLFDIDWQGYRTLQAALPGDVVGIFLLPPSLDQLGERLQNRNADDEAEIARRMAAARDEIAHWQEFDHLVVNDDFVAALAAVRAILAAARTTVARATGAAALARKLTAT